LVAILDLKGITRSFVNGAVRTDVLKGIDLAVNAGDFLSIMGPSGSGKSTLLNIVGCLDRPSTGTYHVAGRAVESLSDGALADLRNHVIGFVFQTFHLLKDLSARDNVELPLIYRGMAAGERHKLAEAALEQVGLAHRMKHFPRQMSGGEQQRVAIARAIVGDPQVILADEPTGALDSKTSLVIMDIFTRLNRERGLTIVQVTHAREVALYGSRIIHIADGMILNEEMVESQEQGGTESVH
jgi:putative ABC transport system ATP-binding protein